MHELIRSRWSPWLALFALALGLRLASYAELAPSPLFSVLVGDARAYDAWADRIAAGDWLGDEVFYQAPLYPYLLAVVDVVWESGPEAARRLQMVLGATSCLLLALAGQRLFSAPVGWIAGLLLALYPAAIFFDLAIQKSSLALFLTTTLLALVALAPDRRHPGWWTATGVVLALLALTRENTLAFVPVVAIWIALGPGPAPRRRAVGLASFVVGLALVLGPVAWRNHHLGGRFLLTTAQLGPNFFIGNNPDADGTYRPLRPHRQDARVERLDATEIAEAAVGRDLDPGEVSEFWFDRSISWIRSDPGGWLRLLGRKALLALNRRELVDSESLEAYREASRMLRSLRWLHFGLLGPLAVLGIWASRGLLERTWVVHALALATLATLVLFYVFGRYRFGLVPPTALFAAVGLIELVRRWRRGSTAARVRALAIVAVAALVSNWPVPVRTDPLATTYYNLGVALLENGRAGEAITQLERAVALRPEIVEVQMSLGRALEAHGDDPGAQQRFEAAAGLDPRHVEARLELGLLLVRSGDLRRAETELRRAAELDPARASAQGLLGNLLAHQGRVEEAMSAYRRAIALDSEASDARFKLGLLLLEQGAPTEAAPHLREAARLLPDFADAHLYLAEALERSGDADGALVEYRRVVDLRPDDASARVRLEALQPTPSDEHRRPPGADRTVDAERRQPPLLP